MNTSYDTFYLDNFIERYAALKGKAILYLRSTGWNNSSDVDAINASMQLYKDILPLDIWTCLNQSEHVFVEVDDITDTLNFLESNLPESQASTSTPENYIFYSLANSSGQIIATNE
jgi:hypothetical protein